MDSTGHRPVTTADENPADTDPRLGAEPEFAAEQARPEKAARGARIGCEAEILRLLLGLLIGGKGYALEQ